MFQSESGPAGTKSSCPGPAIVVIPVALAILAAGFKWTRKLLEKVKRGIWKKADVISFRVLCGLKPVRE